MIVTAIDAHTGELAAFDRDSGVELVDAVTASTALPGLAPTVSINGGRYIDGGVRSAENADLASGYANILVLSPLGGRTQIEPGQFEGLRRAPEWRMDLASQVEDLRKQGSRVEVITPDAIPEPQWARTRWIRRPASPPPVPASPKASGKRLA
jgi:NTE family protein